MQRDDHGDLLRAILTEQSSQRSNLNALCVQCSRVEGQISSLCERMDDMREVGDSDRIAGQAIDARITSIERKAAWIKAWSAGAAAAVTGLFVMVAWLVDKVGGK